ncbi:MAG: hypothetical protein ACP5MB_10360 [bacterium]
MFKKKKWLAANLLMIAGSVVLYWYLSQQLIGGIIFVLAILSFIWEVRSSTSGGGGEDIHKLAELYEQEDARRQAESKTNEKQRKLVERENLALKKIVYKIDETLKSEKISKEDLIAKIKGGRYTILLQKHNEGPEKYIRGRLYSLGFRHINSGIYILPPVKARELDISESFDISDWLKRVLLKGLPNDYKCMINFVSIIDLKNTAAHNNLVKRSKTYLDVLAPEDLIEPEGLIAYLNDKKNISIKDVIQIPNLVFLLDESSVDKKDYEAVRKHNDEILMAIKKNVGSKEIITTDFATINENIIQDVLKAYVSNPGEISGMIIRNAKFWNRNLNGVK